MDVVRSLSSSRRHNSTCCITCISLGKAMPFERRYYIFMGFPMSISGFIEDWGQIRYCWVNTIESMVATVWIDFRPSQDPLDHVLPQFRPSTCF